MKVAIINRSDRRGGAAMVSYRLMESLREAGIDARMIVMENLSYSPEVISEGSRMTDKIPFLTERLGIFIQNGFRRDTLFQIDTASDGLPLSNVPFVREADVICLNWINQGMLSLKELKRLLSLGKPIVWTMHDQWCFTGICHHTGECDRFIEECGYCPLLGSRKGKNDLSRKVWKKKKDCYQYAVGNCKNPITFVAVSNWLRQRAKMSSLLSDQRVVVIPNAFPEQKEPDVAMQRDPKSIVFGAARLDDPVKGLPLLKEALRLLKEEHPELAEEVTLYTFGNFKNPASAEGFHVGHIHLGHLSDDRVIADTYRKARCVVSSSLWETLPGTLVEGQANGCIPVSFDRGGQSDIIDHLSTGYLARFDCEDTPGNARRLMEGIVWALENNHEGIEERMKESVKRKFDSHQIASQYISLFESLL